MAPLARQNARKQSEFGGRAGLIQASSDGHVQLTPGEEAMVMRRQGFSDVVGRSFAEQDKIDAELDRRGQAAVSDEERIPGSDSIVNVDDLAKNLIGRGIHNEVVAENYMQEPYGSG